MAHNRIEISGLDLLRILSGDLSMEDFCHDHSLPSNPFKDALRRCQTIESVEVEPVSDRDDDRAIFHLREYDTAIAPFRMPEDNNQSND